MGIPQGLFNWYPCTSTWKLNTFIEHKNECGGHIPRVKKSSAKWRAPAYMPGKIARTVMNDIVDYQKVTPKTVAKLIKDEVSTVPKHG